MSIKPRNFLTVIGITGLLITGLVSTGFADSNRGGPKTSTANTRQLRQMPANAPAHMPNITRAGAQQAPSPALLGAALYNSNCAACHGMAKRGTSVAKIQNAIQKIGAMSPLKHLTPSQIGAISLY